MNQMSFRVPNREGYSSYVWMYKLSGVPADSKYLQRVIYKEAEFYKSYLDFFFTSSGE